MSARELRMTHGGSRTVPVQPTTKFIPPSQLRQMRGREQVAAVCYRLHNRKIEFLLVQTRGSRWTFPKGSAEPGLTHAQAAALEAFEEAGVHGRMEEASFARYSRRKRGAARGSGPISMAVNAHLCEVLWLAPPQEANRTPTWFSPEKAKRKLREDRSVSDGAEFARVVDRAVARIRWQRTGHPATIDALQKVQFTIERPKGKMVNIQSFASRKKTPRW